jgi:RNA polymerase-interacting CarD/CdnL/TRCF family regulator
MTREKETHAPRDRELGLPPRSPAAIALRLAVGDLVVYASHGIGRVESRQPQRGEAKTLVLVFESGLKVTLPLDRAHDALRSLSGEPELEEVQRTLRADSPPAVEPWSRRHRRSQAKLVAGSVGGLAEIVRDGIERQRRRVKGGPAPVENQLFQQARKLLTAEIATSRGIELDEADAWIARQTAGEPGSTVAKLECTNCGRPAQADCQG